VDDGCQPKVELIAKDRNVIAATFIHFLLKNIGTVTVKFHALSFEESVGECFSHHIIFNIQFCISVLDFMA
jgi:hypothetical protein